MPYATVDYVTNDQVATITLNRPETYNAFDAQLRADLLAATRKANRDPDIRVAVLKGAGRGFSAGADLGATETHDRTSDMLNGEYKPILEEIFHGDTIFVAQVHGGAAGIGSAFAMTCDLMVMSEDAYLYQAFQAIGLVPDGAASWLLLQQIGYRRAMELILEGTKVTALQAQELGLCNRVAAAEELDQFTQDWAKHLAGKAPLSTAATKRLLRNIGYEKHSDAISMEAREQDRLVASKDFQRGVKAFFNKEKPVFEGD